MKLLAGLVLFASATLTAIGVIVLLVAGSIGVVAFVMAIRLKRAVKELEDALSQQATKIAEIAGHLAGS